MAEKSEQLEDVVQNIQNELKNDVEIIAIVGSDRTVYISSSAGDKTSKISVIATTIFELSQRACKVLEKGTPTEIWLKGEDGLIAIYPAGKATLSVVTATDCNLMMLNIACRAAAEKIETILG